MVDFLMIGRGVAQGAEQFYWMKMECMAFSLVREPTHTSPWDAMGAFVTLDGRFALSRERMDLQELMGPRPRGSRRLSRQSGGSGSWRTLVPSSAS